MTRMSHHAALLDGLARHLDARSLGVYDPDGVFTENQRGITVSAFPDSPREVVALTLYSPEFTLMSATAVRRLSAASVQIKYRLAGHPLAGVEYFDSLSSVLDGKRIDLGAFSAACAYLSYTPLGMNNAGAWTFSTNWRFHSLQSL